MTNQYLSDPKDVELEASIQRAIRGMGTLLHVSVRGRLVSLSGLVEDFSTKREIVSVVRGLVGSREVRSALRIARVND